LHRVRGIPKVYYDKGVVALNDGHLDFAIEYLSTAASLDDRSGAVYRSLGDTYFKKSMYEEALRYYAKALQIEPGDESLTKSKQDAQTELTRRRTPGEFVKPQTPRWFGMPLAVSSAIAFMLGMSVLPALSVLTQSKHSVAVDHAGVATQLRQRLAGEPLFSGLNFDVSQLSGRLSISGDVPTEIHKRLVSEIAQRTAGDRIPVVVGLRVVAPQQAKSVLYSVRQGDNLGTVAASQYGDSRMWTKIYAANREKLSSPNDLVVGQVLLIPR